MKIRIKSISGNTPTYETPGSSGMDINAFLDKGEEITVLPGKRALISTGLYLELPKGFEAQIRARSGLSIKKGISLVNGIGTIDSDYRGEIKIPIINFGDEPFTVKNGDRIAQMVIAKYEIIEWDLTEKLDKTKRGDGGFGHTGV